MSKKIEMSLLQNSYDFLNESICYFRKVDIVDGESELISWKFAIINIVQAMELMFKESLRKVHPALVYDNIDKISQVNVKTVSLSFAVERVKNILKFEFTEEESRSIRMAIKLRNEIIHYQFSLTHEEAKTKYCAIFKLLNSFHERYFHESLHNIIDSELWNVEGNIWNFIETKCFFQGEEVYKGYREDLKKCQSIKFYTLDCEKYPRIKYGQEKIMFPEYYETMYERENCHDCGVKLGQYHLIGCDTEVCPKCGLQVFACDCEFEEKELDLDNI